MKTMEKYKALRTLNHAYNYLYQRSWTNGSEQAALKILDDLYELVSRS